MSFCRETSNLSCRWIELLVMSTKQCQNPCSIWASTCLPGMSTCHDWPVKMLLLICQSGLREISGNTLSLFGAQNKGMGTTLQTSLTRVRFCLPAVVTSQGAKKIIFTACHLGKLKVAFTSPDFISTSPKNFLTSRIDVTGLLSFEFLKKHCLPVGQVSNRIH